MTPPTDLAPLPAPPYEATVQPVGFSLLLGLADAQHAIDLLALAALQASHAEVVQQNLELIDQKNAVQADLDQLKAHLRGLRDAAA
jgi:hypothetical protein